MGNIHGTDSGSPLRRRFRICGNRSYALIWGLVLVCAGALCACRHKSSADTEVLDRAGMDYASVQQIRGLNVTAPEIAEILKMRDAGFPDASCVQAVQIYRNRGQAFRGDDLAGMKQAGMTEQTIFALASLKDFEENAGELEAMHLAGLSDAIILEVARRRAESKPVLSGPTLAGLKNAGVRGATLLELVRRGVPDSEGNALIASRRHGASDAQLLHHFSGS
jgi:hypothetical protein